MSKIINSFYIKIVFVFFLLPPTLYNYGQDTALNKYGLNVIHTHLAYQASIRKDSNKVMVDLKKGIQGLALDLRYAGDKNFMKKNLYPSIKTTYLRKPVAAALSAVQKELKKHGLGLKIFDAYRPYSVTEQMWELVKDDRYAANPATGSGHNRGISVDLTIINLRTKRPLNMGTGFDNFSDTAHHNFTALPRQVLHNRLLLKTIMEKTGFKALETEWWHYSFIEPTGYELLDLKFDELRQ